MSSTGTQAIDRAAELLSLVVRSDQALSYTELVEHTGLARSTASRVLQALERNGLLERDRDGGFRGGALFTHYATRFDRVETMVALAQPMLETIAEETGETVNLAVARGDAVVHVSQIDSTFHLGSANWLDTDAPPHCSALGKVMYAYGALPLPAGQLERRTPSTLTDVCLLERELRTVRRDGFAITRGELEEGLDGLAAPVRDSDGHAQAAIGVSGPSFRLEGAHRPIGNLLVAESNRLSALLARRARSTKTRRIAPPA